jgi:hypothetical protein
VKGKLPMKENPMNKLMADLVPEELEPRLELQVFIDPLGAAAFDDTNNNNNNNNKSVDAVAS